MHTKTAVTVLFLILGLGALGFGVLAALGVSINLDLTSPGPIEGNDRPMLEQVAPSEKTSNFKFVN